MSGSCFSVSFPSFQGVLPDIDHDQADTQSEQLEIDISHYHSELYQYQVNPSPNNKPVVLQIAKAYGVPESTLRRHIKNPSQQTIEQAAQKAQILTPAEEKFLVERLIFLDDCNIPADRDIFYSLAHSLLRRREPNRELGCDWILGFLEQHPEIKYINVRTIATSRANAKSRDIMDDFFWKVCTYFYLKIKEKNWLFGRISICLSSIFNYYELEALT